MPVWLFLKLCSRGRRVIFPFRLSTWFSPALCFSLLLKVLYVHYKNSNKNKVFFKVWKESKTSKAHLPKKRVILIDGSLCAYTYLIFHFITFMIIVICFLYQVNLCVLGTRGCLCGLALEGIEAQERVYDLGTSQNLYLAHSLAISNVFWKGKFLSNKTKAQYFIFFN